MNFPYTTREPLLPKYIVTTMTTATKVNLVICFDAGLLCLQWQLWEVLSLEKSEGDGRALAESPVWLLMSLGEDMRQRGEMLRSLLSSWWDRQAHCIHPCLGPIHSHRGAWTRQNIWSFKFIRSPWSCKVVGFAQTWGPRNQLREHTDSLYFH